MECYVFINKKGERGNIYTPAHNKYDYSRVVKLARILDIYQPVKLKPYTLLNKIQLIPAILAAKLARLVRKVTNKKGTYLEGGLMQFYYEQEVKVRGYVE